MKQSRLPLYTFGLFIILVFTTSAGVLMVAAISPAQPLKNEFFKQHRFIIHSLCVLVKHLNFVLQYSWPKPFSYNRQLLLTSLFTFFLASINL